MFQTTNQQSMDVYGVLNQQTGATPLPAAPLVALRQRSTSQAKGTCRVRSSAEEKARNKPILGQKNCHVS